jgi:hypothetical protein
VDIREEVGGNGLGTRRTVSEPDFALSTNNRGRFGGVSTGRPRILRLPCDLLSCSATVPREFRSTTGNLARICFLV